MKGLPVLSLYILSMGVAATTAGMVLAGPDFREPLGCDFF